MNKYSQSIKSVFSLIMIFALLIQQFSCTTTNIISSSNLTISPKYLYKIYYHKSLYLLKEAAISDGILSGKVSDEKSSKVGNIATIYPVSDSAVVINLENTLSIPLDKISQLKMKELEKGKTTALVIGSAVGTVAVILSIIVYFAMQDFHIEITI